MPATLKRGALLAGSFTQIRSELAKIAVCPTPIVFANELERSKPELAPAVTTAVVAAVTTQAKKVRCTIKPPPVNSQ